MNSLTINNGSTFDLSNPSLVDLTINSLFMNAGAHLLGLNSLLVNQIASLSGSIITPGSQTYNGNMLLSGDTLIQTTGSRSQIMINSSVDDLQAGLSNLVLTTVGPYFYYGGHRVVLDLESSGAITLNGAIGSNQPIGSLTVNGITTIGTSISTIGDQTYNNDLTLTNTQSVLNNVSMSTVTGNVNFNGNVTGFKNTVLQFLGGGNYSINGASFNTSTNPASGISLAYNSTAGKYTWDNVDASAVQLLVVGGGGAGGVGGGGGGGVIATTDTLTVGSYSIVVGAGGLAPNDQAYPGGNGGFSQFGTLKAFGGGGGGSAWSADGTQCCWNNNPGNSGGSGGGGSYNGWNNIGGSGTTGQGYAGGQGVVVRNDSNGYQYWQAGGGGGAGASPTYVPNAQNSGNTNYAGSGSIGNGGVGYASSITGTQVYYGGGGGGGKDSGQSAPNVFPGVSLGGNGGGGNGGYYNGSQWVPQTPGVANTGGGGGGTWWCCSDGKFSAGGSGIVILNGALASFSRANLAITTNTGLINFAAGKVFNNIGTLSIFTNRNDQTLSTGIVTNANTTGLTTGGTGKVTISGLSNYAHTITVMGGTLSLINSPSQTLSIDTLILEGGGLALDVANSTNLMLNP
jgi:hypothetical protein